jgi:hypothetical protein
MNANYFTTTLLPLHIKLQGLYREKCGDWLTGDEGWVVYRGRLVWFTVIQNFAEGLLGGVLHTITEDFGKVNFDNDDPALIRIPRTIDDSSPEASRRSLWGMLNGTKTLCDYHKAEQGLGQQGEIDIGVGMNSEYKCFKGKTPTEAILKALCSQENIILDK